MELNRVPFFMSFRHKTAEISNFYTVYFPAILHHQIKEMMQDKPFKNKKTCRRNRKAKQSRKQNKK